MWGGGDQGGLVLGLLLVVRVPVRSTQVNDTRQQQCMGSLA